MAPRGHCQNQDPDKHDPLKFAKTASWPAFPSTQSELGHTQPEASTEIPARLPQNRPTFPRSRKPNPREEGGKKWPKKLSLETAQPHARELLPR